jgi:hypothetical protein
MEVLEVLKWEAVKFIAYSGITIFILMYMDVLKV